MKFNRKVIVVTGAGSGLGTQIATDLFHQGATVCLLGRTLSKLEKLKVDLTEAKSMGGKCLVYPCDISSPDETAEVFQQIKKDGFVVSGLVSNAGINPSRNNILKTTYEEWQNTLNTNLTGAYNCSKRAIEHMQTIGFGSIVNVSSIAGITALTERSAYMASKWGLVGLSLSTALDFASQNIRVNCVCPGYVETPLVSKFLHNLPSERYTGIVNAHPMRRLGKPTDISNAVLFLLSDDASWITGAILPVDGGYCIGKEY